jgi:hypothetical protein
MDISIDHLKEKKAQFIEEIAKMSNEELFHKIHEVGYDDYMDDKETLGYWFFKYMYAEYCKRLGYSDSYDNYLDEVSYT